jgi:integrase
MPRAPAHCRYKGRLLEGILNIPADTRFAFGNKKQFLANLHTSDPVQAAALIGPLVREWKGRIASVRAGLHDPQRDMIDTLAARYRKLHDPMSDADARLVADAIDFVFQRIGGATAIEQAKALADARGDVPEALQTTPHARRAVNALNQIARPGDAVTPFLTYLERWEATLSKTKVHAAWIAILKEFDLAVGQPLEALAGHHVQRWIDDLLSRVSPVTVRYKIGGLIAYWKYLASHQIVDGERNPFKGRQIKSRKSKVERAAQKRLGFRPSEIPGLWAQAEQDGDYELSYAIQLSSGMGWRLEEVCRLKIADVKRTGGVLHIDAGLKTEAGLRDLPVPTLLIPLVAKLMKRRDSDGYLIRSMASNQWGQRGTSIGTRFSKMKRRLEYDRRKTFHSLRHSFASMLNSAGTPMALIRDILGHEDGNVTLGYIDETPLRERLVWLDRAIVFPAI